MRNLILAVMFLNVGSVKIIIDKPFVSYYNVRDCDTIIQVGATL